MRQARLTGVGFFSGLARLFEIAMRDIDRSAPHTLAYLAAHVDLTWINCLVCTKAVLRHALDGSPS
jgi:hypothetical protein